MNGSVLSVPGGEGESGGESAGESVVRVRVSEGTRLCPYDATRTNLRRASEVMLYSMCSIACAA